jgi:hypothetical protein
MSDKGIIMSAPMILAHLAGRKNETRRLVKPPECAKFHGRVPIWEKSYKDDKGSDSEYLHVCVSGDNGDLDPGWITWHRVFCRYQTGDRLYFKEIYRPAGRLGTEYLVEYRVDSSERTIDVGFEGPTPEMDAAIQECVWRSSMFMPKMFARIWAEVVSVHAEKLADITEEGATAEGCEPAGEDADGFIKTHTALQSYRLIWDQLYGAGAWERDRQKWVWVIKYKELAK